MLTLLAAPASSVLLVAAAPYEARYDGRPATHWASRPASKDPAERRSAAFALSSIACCGGVGTRASGHVRELTAALQDPDVEVRTTAAAVLGCSGADARVAMKALVEALRDTDVLIEHRPRASGRGDRHSRAAHDPIRTVRDERAEFDDLAGLHDPVAHGPAGVP